MNSGRVIEVIPGSFRWLRNDENPSFLRCTNRDIFVKRKFFTSKSSLELLLSLNYLVLHCKLSLKFLNCILFWSLRSASLRCRHFQSQNDPVSNSIKNISRWSFPFLSFLWALTVWPEVKGQKSPPRCWKSHNFVPPQCQKSHTFWSKNPTFWGIFFENLTPPTIFIAFLCINFFQILKNW